MERDPCWLVPKEARHPWLRITEKRRTVLTMSEAATHLGVSHYFIRAMIKRGVLPARQIMKDAPWQIMAADLELSAVQEALQAHHARRRPCRRSREQLKLKVPTT